MQDSASVWTTSSVPQVGRSDTVAEYQENQIVLSGEASKEFQQRMERPDAEVLRRRDQTLEWIALNMSIEETETGFSVEVLGN